MISFIMMARNVEPFLAEAVAPLQSETGTQWELVLVEDHSDDRTYEIAAEIAAADTRVRLFRNPHRGKVAGTSFGFAQSRGEIIKCIDSDDVLLPEIFGFLQRHHTHDVLFHSARIADAKLAPIVDYHPNSRWLNGDTKEVIENLVSFPKFSWSFTRAIAEKVFPLPDALPFEDVWMALMLRKYCHSPAQSRQPLYLYRQHGSQTFGGILNYSSEAVRFRALRLLRLIDVLEGEARLSAGIGPLDFSRIKAESRYLGGEGSVLDCLRQGVDPSRVPRLLAQMWFPGLARRLAVAKWRHEGRRALAGAG